MTLGSHGSKSKRSRSPRSAVRPLVECLEPRRLLSGGLPQQDVEAAVLLRTNPGRSEEVVVTWRNVDSNPGAQVLIDFSTDQTFANAVQTTTVTADAAGTTQTSLLEGLVDGTVYYIRLRSMDASGTSAGSNIEAVIPVGLDFDLERDYSLGFTSSEVGLAGSGANELQLNGGASVTADNRLELTSGMNDQNNSALTVFPVTFDVGFITTFDFRVSGGTSDSFGEGFAFLMENAPAKAGAIGNGAGSLGVVGVPNAAAVIFSTSPGSANNPTPGDPQSSNSGLSGTDQLGNDPSFPEFVTPSPRQQTPVPLVFNSGDTFEVILHYDPGVPELREQITDVSNLAAPTYIHTYDGTDLVDNLGDNAAYVGFTATTSSRNQTVDILNWAFSRTPGPPPADFVSTGLGDGVSLVQAQRSEVRSMYLGAGGETFSLLPGAVTMQRYDGTTSASLLTDATDALGTPVTTDGGLHWTIPIPKNGPLSDSTGSLVDGIYKVVIHASRVILGGVPLRTGDEVFTFHRLLGDIDGNKTVNNSDYFQFTKAFGRTVGDPLFNPDFDFDANGKINNADYFAFTRNFGKKFIIYP